VASVAGLSGLQHFHAFFALNLKPELRSDRTIAFWVQLIAAEIHALLRLLLTAAPP
jgi:hypothetical protein